MKQPTQTMLAHLSELDQKLQNLKASAAEAKQCADDLHQYVDTYARFLPNVQQVIAYIAHYTSQVNAKLNEEKA